MLMLPVGLLQEHSPPQGQLQHTQRRKQTVVDSVNLSNAPVDAPVEAAGRGVVHPVSALDGR